MSVAPSKRLPTTRPNDCPDSACGAPLQLPYLCHMCGTLLRPPPGLSHFERFGLEPSMDVDPEDLEARYLDLSRRMHPDRMIGKESTTQSRALLLSSALNEAYAELRDERLRAEHLLHTLGGRSAEEDKRTPQALLMEMMELHEEVEDGCEPARTTELIERAETERAACLTRVRELFAQGPLTQELADAIREQLNVVKYWVTLSQELQGTRAD